MLASPIVRSRMDSWSRQTGSWGCLKMIRLPAASTVTPRQACSSRNTDAAAQAFSMALLNLLLCQIGDDTLGSTVELRWNALVKRSDLGDMKLPAGRKG